MSGNFSDDGPPMLRVFVGRSFAPDDQPVWDAFREMLEALRPLGVVYEDAKEATPGPVSAKIRELIERNDVYLGILTRRHPIAQPQPAKSRLARVVEALRQPATTKWAPSEWVVEEVGFALGRGRGTLLAIESGLTFPASDLAADREWFSFDRSAVSACQNALTSQIGHLLHGKLPRVDEPVTAARSATAVGDVPPPEGEGPAPQILAFMRAAKAGEFDRCAALERSILDEETTEDGRTRTRLMLLGMRARHSDAEAIRKLEDLAAQTPRDPRIAIELASAYTNLHEHNRALATLKPLSENGKNQELGIAVVRTLLAAERYAEAKSLSIAVLREARSNDDRKAAIDLMADVAKASEDRELEASILECAVRLDPAGTDTRFRLAFLYSEIGKDRVAAYHYRILTQGKRDPVVFNNLAVAYGRLDLKGREKQSLLMASANSALGKANLSNAYITAGFLESGVLLAEEVLREGTDEQASAIARDALGAADKIKRNEQGVVDSLERITAQERDFRAAFAEAMSRHPAAAASGSYVGENNDVELVIDGDNARGTRVKRVQSSSALASLLALSSSVSPEGKLPLEVLSYEISGDVMGCAAQVQFREVSRSPGRETPRTLLGGERASVTMAQLVIAEDGQSLRIMEHDGGTVSIFRVARRAGSA
jgi:hypothetical protein